jgi:hypothetical protein
MRRELGDLSMNQATQASTNTSVKAQDLLATELATYQRELSRLLTEGEEGRWVLVKGSDVISTWDTFEDAIQIGYDRFGQTAFLVQQVRAEQPVAQQPWQRS